MNATTALLLQGTLSEKMWTGHIMLVKEREDSGDDVWNFPCRQLRGELPSKGKHWVWMFFDIKTITAYLSWHECRLPLAKKTNRGFYAKQRRYKETFFVSVQVPDWQKWMEIRKICYALMREKKTHHKTRITVNKLQFVGVHQENICHENQ